MAGSTPKRNIRISNDLWQQFVDTIKRTDPELDASTVLRQLIRRYIAEHAPEEA